MENERIHTYGRKRARGLSNTQACALTNWLSSYSVSLSDEKVDLKKSFRQGSGGRLVIEIGFGHGEHLAQMALENRSDMFIGCETFENGVAKAITKIRKYELENVLIYKGDARDVLDSALSQSVSAVYILFPDPWPKKRHIKRRIVSEELLCMLNRVVVCDGSIMIASDCVHYVEHVIDVVEAYNNKYGETFMLSSRELEKLKLKPDVFGATRYERKAIAAGKQCYYMVISRRIENGSS